MTCYENRSILLMTYIGHIETTNKNTIVVKRGILNVHYYYIPTDVVEGWDEQPVTIGRVLIPAS